MIKIKNIVKALISALATQSGILYVMHGEFDVNIPILNWLFAVFKGANGWGIEAAVLFCGCAAVFQLCMESPLQKNKWLNGMAAFWGLWMVLGRSYEEVGTWEYVINTYGGFAQLILAFVVALGYFWLFKNFAILGIQTLQRSNWRRTDSKNKLETLLFEKYPFRLSLAFLTICCLPFLISFYPGALHGDGHAQVWAYLGVIDWNAHHPVMSTLLMGKCMEIGLEVFQSASIGMFLYTGTQYIVQWVVFAYVVKALCRMKAPMSLRWGALLFFAFFPSWQIWGYTIVKDVYYYLGFLLFVVQLAVINVEGKLKWKDVILLAIGITGTICMRNNGIHVLAISLVTAIFLNRKFWKLHFVSLLYAFALVFLIESVYMPLNDIEKGAEREMLSIPVQQTARYLKYHMNEVTPAERESLESVFTVSLEEVVASYNPEVSDPVKALFAYHPTEEQFKAYFGVWFKQLKKHPATYVQAFLNHVYGYFYPDRECFWDPIGFYSWGHDGHWDDGYLKIEFGLEECELRDFYKQSAYTLYALPFFGMLYSSGMHTYILIGMCLFLFASTQKKNIFLFVPSLVTLLVCLVSPVNAFMRYMFPIIICLPVYICWCNHCILQDAGTKDK